MHRKFEINQTKIKGSCQSGRKVMTHYSKSDLPLGKMQKLGSVAKKYVTNSFQYCIESNLENMGLVLCMKMHYSDLSTIMERMFR